VDDLAPLLELAVGTLDELGLHGRAERFSSQHLRIWTVDRGRETNVGAHCIVVARLGKTPANLRDLAGPWMS
jgi:hypothetical protein